MSEEEEHRVARCDDADCLSRSSVGVATTPLATAPPTTSLRPVDAEMRLVRSMNDITLSQMDSLEESGPRKERSKEGSVSSGSGSSQIFGLARLLGADDLLQEHTGAGLLMPGAVSTRLYEISSCTEAGLGCLGHITGELKSPYDSAWDSKDFGSREQRKDTRLVATRTARSLPARSCCRPGSTGSGENSKKSVDPKSASSSPTSAAGLLMPCAVGNKPRSRQSRLECMEAWHGFNALAHREEPESVPELDPGAGVSSLQSTEKWSGVVKRGRERRRAEIDGHGRACAMELGGPRKNQGGSNNFRACIQCRQAKRKCSPNRPCSVCILRGCADECTDADEDRERLDTSLLRGCAEECTDAGASSERLDASLEEDNKSLCEMTKYLIRERLELHEKVEAASSRNKNMRLVLKVMRFTCGLHEEDTHAQASDSLGMPFTVIGSTSTSAGASILPMTNVAADDALTPSAHRASPLQNDAENDSPHLASD